MKNELGNNNFPLQRVSNATKESADWYASCCDWIIAKGVGMRQNGELQRKYDILEGNIDREDYKNILNPYNATDEKYTKFPATMKNYDMMKGILRRFVSEYLKSLHEFIIGANNPDIVLGKNAKLKEELAAMVEEKIAARIQEAYQQFVEQGGDVTQFNPQTAIDIEGFIKDFNKNYIDETSAQAQEIFNVIRDITDDALLYSKCYFDFVAFGECYSYTDVVGSTLIKRHISAIDAYPINTDNTFREDDGMFACRRKLSYQQLMDEFDKDLDKDQRKFLETYYSNTGDGTASASLSFATYESYFPDVCQKYSTTERNSFTKGNKMMRDYNDGLYDVWHTVWRGEIRRSIVTYVNEMSILSSRVEDGDYVLNKAMGDISIEHVYEPQVYECVRIGGRHDAIYPYKARAIAFNRGGKLPYNGLNEILPGFGKFSIVEIVFPFQVFRNIVYYHREMAISKAKSDILIIPISLLGADHDSTIHKMIADNVLYVDDSNDHSLQRAQNIRMVSAQNTEYITYLTNLIDNIETVAKNQVDMTPQRYGEIANTAGKGTTEEAINRGSMGSVIIEYVMDCMRERDYARDLDMSKYAWIDGLNTSYRDSNNDLKYVSLDIDLHMYADYVIKAKNSAKETEKFQQLKQFAFSAAQNGDLNMAIAAIESDNVGAAVKLMKEFSAKKDEMERAAGEQAKEIERMKQEFELARIAAKGEQDRLTEEVKGTLEAEVQLIKADANMVSFENGVSEANKQAGINRLEGARNQVQREKIEAGRENSYLDAFGKAQDRKLKEKDIDTKLKIAETNRNKYDKPKTKAK